MLNRVSVFRYPAQTSPSLSNLIASQLDRRLIGYTSRIGLTYTRYADDICISTNDPVVLKKAIYRIQKIIINEHFEINTQKTRLCGPSKKVSVTGLVKNTNGPKFSIGRNVERRMRAIMHALKVKGKPDINYPTEESILGWLSYLKSVDSIKAAKLSNYFTGLNTTP